MKKGAALARVDTTSLVAARTAARSSYDAALAQLDEDVDDGASDVQVAADRSSVVVARSSWVEARDAVDDAVLRAPMAGTVVGLDLAVGDTVGAGTTAGDTSGGSAAGAGTGSTATTTTSGSVAEVSIATTRWFAVDAEVAAADIEGVEQGLQVELTVSGVDETVYGTVATVGAVAETSASGAAVFPVVVEVTGKRQDLYAGSSADLSIIVSQTHRRGHRADPGRADRGRPGLRERGGRRHRGTPGHRDRRGVRRAVTEVTSGPRGRRRPSWSRASPAAAAGTGSSRTGRTVGRACPAAPRPADPPAAARSRGRPSERHHRARRRAQDLRHRRASRSTPCAASTPASTQGEYVAVIGPSGSGKSTLMHILGCLDVPTAGQLPAGRRGRLGDDRGAARRRPQPPHRLRLPAVQPACRASSALAQRRAAARLRRRARRRAPRAGRRRPGAGRASADRAGHRPGELSGGQQQRVAVARALVTEPALILADEPTGNLDSTSTADVLGLLDELHDAGRTIVLITHEHEVAARAGRNLVIDDGEIVSDVPTARPSWRCGRELGRRPCAPASRPSAPTGCARCSPCSASSSASPR